MDEDSVALRMVPKQPFAVIMIVLMQ